MKAPSKKLQPLIAAGILTGLCSIAYGQTTTFGSDNDGLGGFTHTAIDSTNTLLNTGTDSVQYRNQNTGTINAGFIKQYDSIDRTADSGLVYTVSGTFTVSDGYADDNNRLGLVLFSDETTVLDRDNLGQIGIIWNTDDNTVGGAPGSNTQDNLNILNGYNNVDADTLNAPSTLRNQATPFAQDLLQGSQITMTATFWFTGTDINIDATMTDAGGLTTLGTATVTAGDFTGEYFGFASAYRARNYDGTPDPTGATRDNPLVMDYESFSLSVIPEPSTLTLLGVALGAIILFRRRN